MLLTSDMHSFRTNISKTDANTCSINPQSSDGLHPCWNGEPLPPPVSTKHCIHARLHWYEALVWLLHTSSQQDVFPHTFRCGWQSGHCLGHDLLCGNAISREQEHWCHHITLCVRDSQQVHANGRTVAGVSTPSPVVHGCFGRSSSRSCTRMQSAARRRTELERRGTVLS